jgi:hypothetical protein
LYFFLPNQESLMSESLLEYAALRNPALRIDRAAHRLRGVKILGFASTNGRTYELEVVRRALPLYEGARVNVNHPPGAAPSPRDYHDRLGTLVEVRLDEGQGLFGDLFYNPKHPLVEQLLWDAEHAPHNVGLSHNVLARTARRGDTTAVTEIVAVVSVDLVADPATTRGLFEEQESYNSKRRVPGDEHAVLRAINGEDPERKPSSEREQSTHAGKQLGSLPLSTENPESNTLSQGLTSPVQDFAESAVFEAQEIRALREQLAAALLREAGLREELERRAEISPRNVTQTPRSREQAAESLKRGPQLTREQVLQTFVAAVKRK